MYPANKMVGGVKQGGNKETSSVQARVVPYNLHKNVNICGDLEMVVCQHNPIIKEYGLFNEKWWCTFYGTLWKTVKSFECIDIDQRFCS